MQKFIEKLDLEMQNINTYYKDLISGSVLKRLEVVIIKKEGFRKYMHSIGKLGGQNKVPRLANDKKIAEKIIQYI